jgi:hypothetical protein
LHKVKSILFLLSNQEAFIVKSIQPEVLPPEQQTQQQQFLSGSVDQPSLQDCFNQGFSNGQSFYGQSVRGHAPHQAQPSANSFKDPMTMPANELSNFFGWVADQKGRIFLSALGAFFVLFVSSVVVARSSANLSGIRANSLATATGSAGAASMITLLYILSAKIPGSKD